MKKTLSITLASIVAISGLQAAEDLSSMFSEGKASGQIREFSIVRSVTDTRPSQDEYTRKANAIGGFLKFETAELNGLSLGSAFYTTNGFLLQSPRDDSNPEADPSLLGPNNEDYSILGEAYLQYKRGNTTFKGGRQKLTTPLADADDYRMLPNLFEAYMLSNTDIPDTTLVVGHITRFAQGTFGRVYSGANLPNQILAATAGASAVDPKNQVGSFENMGSYAVGTRTDGVSVASATYTGVKGLKVQLWDYYAYDILNAVYGQVDYSMQLGAVKPFVAGQFIKEDNVGDSLLKNLGGDGKIDSLFWGVKAGMTIENFTAYIAYTETGANDASDTANGTEYANAIITPWGGIPAFTQGMVTRHMFLAGTKASKAALSYSWKGFGPDLKTIVYYLNHKMADFNGYTLDDASEAGFDVIYNTGFVDNLQLRLRGNFTSDFYVASTGAVDWDEYRFIVNYNF